MKRINRQNANFIWCVVAVRTRCIHAESKQIAEFSALRAADLFWGQFTLELTHLLFCVFELSFELPDPVVVILRLLPCAVPISVVKLPHPVGILDDFVLFVL